MNENFQQLLLGKENVNFTYRILFLFCLFTLDFLQPYYELRNFKEPWALQTLKLNWKIKPFFPSPPDKLPVWKQVQGFHYMGWHLFMINSCCVWGRLPINQSCMSTFNSSRPFCSSKKTISLAQNISFPSHTCGREADWQPLSQGLDLSSETDWYLSRLHTDNLD